MSVWRQRDSMTVHLVNLTNPMMMKGPLREVTPVGLLTAGTTPGVQHAGGVMTVTVPVVELHEVIAIDL